MKNVLAVLLFLIVAVLSVATNAQTNLGRGLMINEVYIGTAGVSDQFIEIYNPQSTTQYLDGCMIVQFDTIGGKLSGQTLGGALRGWKFPGAPGGRTLPVRSKEFVVVAASAAKNTGGVDLSGAGYEAHGSFAQSNPNAQQLTTLSAAMTYSGLAPSVSGDAIVLTNGSDATIADGVDISSIFDAVQYGPTIKQGNFPLSIDSMRTGGQYLKPGYSIERNKPGVTTHSSYNDFALQYPTPGVQHVTQQEQVVTPGDLLPFELHRFVAFNQYDTATAGASPSRFLSSQIVMQTGLSYQTKSAVALIRDSSYTSGSSTTISDLHFHVTSASDIEGYADDQLMQYIFGSFSSNVNAPNTWIPYLKMSAGKNVAYTVATITGSYSIATLNIPIVGAYRGIERVTVAKGTFDSAYRFDLIAHVQIKSLVGNDSIIIPTSIWLVKGIGLVKRSNPFVTKTIAGQAIPVDGSERDLYAFGIQGQSSVKSAEQTMAHLAVYPNPASTELHLSAEKPIASVTLLDSRGAVVLSRELGNARMNPRINIQSVHLGSYLLRVEYDDGILALERVTIAR